MTGKCYYLTTLGDWKRRAGSFANSHWLAVEKKSANPMVDISARDAVAGCPHLADDTPILALIEADEGAHGALEDDQAFEALPHPLSQKPISASAQSLLSSHGVVPGASTFDAAEIVARAHPLLRHRVF
jgi:hypothetical protein